MTIQELEGLSPGDWFYDLADQLKHHIYRRSLSAFAAGDAARDAITTRLQLEDRQHDIRTHFLSSIGGLPPMDTPLDARTVGEESGPCCRIEKVIFQSRPRHYVTANLYLPDGLREPRGAVQFLCGHHRDAKHQPEYQIVCQYLAQAGLVVLAQDPIGQGERFSYWDAERQDTTVSWGCPDHDHAGAQCLPLGDALARYFLHDAMRGIDYLASRPEVDAHRIGVTGNSGGGTQTCLMMMGDARIAAAAPATFIMNRESYMAAGGAQDAEQIWPGFSAAGLDHEDIVLAMAPRPVRVLSVTSDYFPIEGARRTVSRCRRFWDLCGRPGDLDGVEDLSTHCYTPILARAAATFFARHLLDREPSLDDGRIQPLEPRQLWCTSSGQVGGELPDAEFVFEANFSRLEMVDHERRSLPQSVRRERGVQWLREKVHHDRKPCDLNPRFYHKGRLDDLEVSHALWWSQEGLFNQGCVFRALSAADRTLPVTVAIWDEGTRRLEPYLDWIRSTCAGGRAVLALETSGVGSLAPRSITRSDPFAFYGVIHKLADDLIWLDDSLPAIRTFDVLRALEMIAEWPGLDSEDIRVYAHGRHGLYGRLAALLDERIRCVEIAGEDRDPIAWVRTREYDSRDLYSIVMPGMLRHFDLPELEVPSAQVKVV